jgi:DNA-binding GntR family transcriptional regulator
MTNKPKIKEPRSASLRKAVKSGKVGQASKALKPSKAALANEGKLNQSDLAYERLRDLIMSGAIPPGSFMLELEAAERLAMSRTPVREAMVRLRSEGIIEIRARHGMRVLPVSADDMREIYEVLTSLESTAAGLVAKRGIDAASLAGMKAAVAAMDAALARDDLEAWAQADEDFHRILTRSCGNRRLIQTVDQFWSQAHRARLLTLRLRPRPTQSNREHAALVRAIAKGNVEAAVRIHQDHRERAGRLLTELLSKLS